MLYMGYCQTSGLHALDLAGAFFGGGLLSSGNWVTEICSQAQQL